VTADLLILLASGAVGAVLGALVRLPMWPITGALLGSAVANVLLATTVTMPAGLSFFAQVLVGTAVGASVLPGFLTQLRTLLLPALAVTVTLVAAGLSAAMLMSGLGLVGARESLLGMIPGGVGEMVAASAALGADSALVAGMHVIRLLVTLWMLPVLVRWAMSWRRPEGPEAHATGQGS
jgi:membrane AbrB-like protein